MTAAGALGRRGSGRKPGPLPILAWLVPLASALVLLAPGADESCEAESARLAAGELWRLAGAHLAHYSPAHWLLDALVFLVLALECERRAPARTRLALAGAALAIPAGVLALQPELARYRGLSGLDSTLFGLLLALELRAGGSRRALLAGALFLAKLAWELATGRALFLDSQSLGFTPVPLAHALGALAGIAFGLVGTRALRRTGELAGDLAPSTPRMRPPLVPATTSRARDEASGARSSELQQPPSSSLLGPFTRRWLDSVSKTSSPARAPRPTAARTSAAPGGQ